MSEGGGKDCRPCQARQEALNRAVPGLGDQVKIGIDWVISAYDRLTGRGEDNADRSST